jgi:integrase
MPHVRSDGYRQPLNTGCTTLDVPAVRTHPDTLSDYWRQLCTDAKGKQIRLHDARQSCASIMHAQGVPIAVISAWLGHADTAFTMRTYVHVQKDGLKDAAATLQRTGST